MEIIDYITTHQAAVLLAVIAILILFFLIRKLFKFALLFVLVLLAVGGYYYYKAPEEFPENVKRTIGEVKDKTGKVVKGGKKLAEKLDKVMDRVKKATSD